MEAAIRNLPFGSPVPYLTVQQIEKNLKSFKKQIQWELERAEKRVLQDIEICRIYDEAYKKAEAADFQMSGR